MARQMDRHKHSEWQKRLQRFTKSGLTVARFCARERVAVATFWYWRRKCLGQTPDSIAMASTFAPVEVIGSRMVTLRFPAGAVLELPDDRPDLMKKAIEALAGVARPC